MMKGTGSGVSLTAFASSFRYQSAPNSFGTVTAVSASQWLTRQRLISSTSCVLCWSAVFPPPCVFLLLGSKLRDQSDLGHSMLASEGKENAK